MADSRSAGAIYYPAPVPQSGGVDAMRQYVERELSKIRTAFELGRVGGLRLDVLNDAPERPIEGMAYFLAADVVTPGSAMGLYEYAGGAWHKL